MGIVSFNFYCTETLALGHGNFLETRGWRDIYGVGRRPAAAAAAAARPLLFLEPRLGVPGERQADLSLPHMHRHAGHARVCSRAGKVGMNFLVGAQMSMPFVHQSDRR